MLACSFDSCEALVYVPIAHRPSPIPSVNPPPHNHPLGSPRRFMRPRHNPVVSIRATCTVRIPGMAHRICLRRPQRPQAIIGSDPLRAGSAPQTGCCELRVQVCMDVWAGESRGLQGASTGERDTCRAHRAGESLQHFVTGRTWMDLTDGPGLWADRTPHKIERRSNWAIRCTKEHRGISTPPHPP